MAADLMCGGCRSEQNPAAVYQFSEIQPCSQCGFNGSWALILPTTPYNVLCRGACEGPCRPF